MTRQELDVDRYCSTNVEFRVSSIAIEEKPPSVCGGSSTHLTSHHLIVSQS